MSPTGATANQDAMETDQRVSAGDEFLSTPDIPNRGIPAFAMRAERSIGTAASALRFNDTQARRVLRRFSIKEITEFLGYDRTVLTTLLSQPDAPQGEVSGRERTFSVDEIMRLRVLASRPGSRGRKRKPSLFWRRPGDRLPVITVAAQKGGTGKTLTAAHLAQFAHLFYGMRVGVIDADPQSSVSLYFADDQIQIAGLEVQTFTNFMGVGAPAEPFVNHAARDLDTFWRRTPWPGLRLMPGGVSIQEADISMHFLGRSANPSHRRVYRLLRDAIHKWEQAFPPRTDPADFFDAKGVFRDHIFQEALYETLDLVIIDSAPALTLAQLNAVVAADTLIIPQTMKGFDLSTLRIYLNSLSEYLRFIASETDPVQFHPVPSYILPTIVSTNSDTDFRHVGELYSSDPDVVCPIFYARSEAVANAAEDYLSIYEYLPPKGRRASAEAFIANANAVGDAILSRAIPGLASRGFANRFIETTLPNGTPKWTKDEA